MRDIRCWAKSPMQSMLGVLGRWHRLLHVRALLTRWYDRRQEVHEVSSWPLLYPELLHQEGPTTRSQMREERDQEYHIANQLQQKCKKRQFLSIHDRFIRDTWFRKTMLELGRTEEGIREMDRLANEDHKQEILQIHSWSLFDSPITTSRKGETKATATGRSRGITSTSLRIRSRRNTRIRFLVYSRPVHPWWEVPQEHVWHWSHGRNVSWDGQIGKRRPHAPLHSRKNLGVLP